MKSKTTMVIGVVASMILMSNISQKAKENRLEEYTQTIESNFNGKYKFINHELDNHKLYINLYPEEGFYEDLYTKFKSNDGSYQDAMENIDGETEQIYYHLEDDYYDIETRVMDYNGQEVLLESDNGRLSNYRLEDYFDDTYLEEKRAIWAAESEARLAAYKAERTLTVWVSDTGNKHHSISNCGNMNPNRARQIKINPANLRDCKNC
ncbi:MAG: hypothetical protein ACRCXT_09465 [Paraclostridium sp.]